MDSKMIVGHERASTEAFAVAGDMVVDYLDNQCLPQFPS